MVVWQGISPSVPNEWDIHGRIVDDSGAPVTPDFRISSVPGTYPFPAGGFSPDVTYNQQLNEYFVVWQAHVPGVDTRVQGQRVGPAGNLIGPVRVLSPATGYAQEPEIAYDPERDRFLVTWMYTVGSEREVYAQRLDGTGVLLGGQVRVSEMGPDGVGGYLGQYPEVDYNESTDEYLVVWHGRDAAADGDEAFAQRVSALGVPVGPDIPVSDMGNGSSTYSAGMAVVAANDRDGEYLVAWRGNDNAVGLGPNEVELFGQVLAGDGSQVGLDDFRITHVGPDGSQDAAPCGRLSVAHGARGNEYAVVACAQEPAGQRHILSQAVTARGVVVPLTAHAASDVRSDVHLHSTGVAYNPSSDQFLAAWQQGADSSSALEIFARRLGNGPPTARFDWTPGEPDVDQPVRFDATRSSDADGAIVSYEWDLDDNGVYEASGPVLSHSFPTLGGHRVGLRVTDEDGAKGFVWHTVTVVDGAPPTSSHSCAPRFCEDWQPGPVQVSVTGTDAASGVAKINYRVDGGPWVEVSGRTARFEVTGAGANTISYYAVDNAGNQEAQNDAIVRIDSTGPQTTIDLVAANRPVRTLAGGATDDLSGVASIEVTFVDNLDQTIYKRTADCLGCPRGTSVRWQVSTAGLPNGTYTVSARSSDFAGNAGPPSAQQEIRIAGPGL